MCWAVFWGTCAREWDLLLTMPGQMRSSLAAALQALQECRLTAPIGQHGEYALCWMEDRTGRRPFLRMAVSRASWVGGGLCHALPTLGDKGQGNGAELLEPGERQGGRFIAKLEPGAREWRLTLITEGVNTPDLMEEQGEMVRLSDARDPSVERT